jgi:uncharacterized protein YecE (DUF72 family)
MDIRVGCCGFALAQARYFRRFPVVEVQQTFYQPPQAKTLQRWRERAPADFEFTLKAWQLITHEPSSPTYRRLRKPIAVAARSRHGFFRPTREVQEAWHITLESARALAARVVVFQCPASFAPTPEHVRHLRAFFRAARQDAPGLVFGWEPRGDWPRSLVAQLCRDLGLLYVVDPFRQEPLPGRLRYFRLHGRTGYRYRYTDEDLETLLGLCGQDGIAYCLFNNLSMAEDAERFLHLIGHR